MSDVWTPREWAHPAGATVRLWPYVPIVVMPKALRRRTGDWDALGLLHTVEEPDFWAETEADEAKSPGINFDHGIATGGHQGRTFMGMRELQSLQVGLFPDPEPRRLHKLADSASGKGTRQVFWIEPTMEDAQHLEWLEACRDEMIRWHRLLARIWAGRRWRRALKVAMREVTPPRDVESDGVAFDMARAAALSIALWRAEDAELTPDLVKARNTRDAGRIRGAAATLAEGQVDGASPPVLLIPVPVGRLDALWDAIRDGGDDEMIQEVDTDE